MNQTALVFACAAIVGTLGLKRYPFPDSNAILQMILFHKPFIFHALRWGWFVMLFTTPGLLFSGIFSLVFIFTSNKQRAGKSELPPFPSLSPADRLSVVVGELHEPRRAVEVEHPSWLTIPDRGLFTGMAIFGAIGSGKTTCCMHPFAKQILEYRANDPHRRIGGVVMEVKGDFCFQIRKLLEVAGRPEDYVEISLTGIYRYNPLNNDLDAFTLAYSIASLLNNLYGKGKEPFWQQAYTNLIKFVILLHKVVDNYVTLFQVYTCAISGESLKAKIAQGDNLFTELHPKTLPRPFVVIDAAVYQQSDDLGGWNWENWKGLLRTPRSKDLETKLQQQNLSFLIMEEPAELDAAAVAYRQSQFEAVKRWYTDDWSRLQEKLRSSVVEGVAVFLSMFDDNPDLKRVFCPPKECYDLKLNEDGRYGVPLPAFGALIEAGKVVALNFPISANPGVARAVGVFMKQDFQRAMLNRIPEMEKHPKRYFRESLFLCDEYQAFATVGESDPTGDEKFFALSRQAKCIAIVASQSISSLQSTLPGDTWRTLLQTFRTKIFLSLSDDFSAKIASDLCGREEQMSPNYSISESGQDVRVSTLTGRALAHKAGMTVNKSFSMAWRPVFEAKRFMELKNAQAIVLAYDGVNPLPPQLCYLKPYYLDPNIGYFEQLARKQL